MNYFLFAAVAIIIAVARIGVIAAKYHLQIEFDHTLGYTPFDRK